MNKRQKPRPFPNFRTRSDGEPFGGRPTYISDVRSSMTLHVMHVTRRSFMGNYTTLFKQLDVLDRNAGDVQFPCKFGILP